MMTDRRALGRRLFEVTEGRSDLEIAFAVGVDARKVAKWRGQVAAGRPITITHPQRVQMYIEDHDAR